MVDIDTGRESRDDTRIWDDPHAPLASGAYDAFVLATPAPLHYDVPMDALNKPLPVFCEKPLTVDAATAREIVDATTKAPVSGPPGAGATPSRPASSSDSQRRSTPNSGIG